MCQVECNFSRFDLYLIFDGAVQNVDRDPGMLMRRMSMIAVFVMPFCIVVMFTFVVLFAIVVVESFVSGEGLCVVCSAAVLCLLLCFRSCVCVVFVVFKKYRVRDVDDRGDNVERNVVGCGVTNGVKHVNFSDSAA